MPPIPTPQHADIVAAIKALAKWGTSEESSQAFFDAKHHWLQAGLDLQDFYKWSQGYLTDEYLNSDPAGAIKHLPPEAIKIMGGQVHAADLAGINVESLATDPEPLKPSKQTVADYLGENDPKPVHGPKPPVMLPTGPDQPWDPQDYLDTHPTVAHQLVTDYGGALPPGHVGSQLEVTWQDGAPYLHDKWTGMSYHGPADLDAVQQKASGEWGLQKLAPETRAPTTGMQFPGSAWKEALPEEQRMIARQLMQAGTTGAKITAADRKKVMETLSSWSDPESFAVNALKLNNRGRRIAPNWIDTPVLKSLHEGASYSGLRRLAGEMSPFEFAKWLRDDAPSDIRSNLGKYLPDLTDGVSYDPTIPSLGALRDQILASKEELHALNMQSMRGLPDMLPLLRGGEYLPGTVTNAGGYPIRPRSLLPTTTNMDVAKSFMGRYKPDGPTITEFQVPQADVGVNLRAWLPHSYPHEKEFLVPAEVLAKNVRGGVGMFEPSSMPDLPTHKRSLTFADDLGSAHLGMLGDLGIGIGSAVAADPLTHYVAPNATHTQHNLMSGAIQGAGMGYMVGHTPISALIGAAIGAGSRLLPTDTLARQLTQSLGFG